MSIGNHIAKAAFVFESKFKNTINFSGIGLQLAMDRKFKKYDISHYTKISFSDLTSVKDINKLKYNFSAWILSCCFRELIEHLDIFFSKICNILESSNDYDDKKFKFKDKLDLIVKHLHNPRPSL